MDEKRQKTRLRSNERAAEEKKQQIATVKYEEIHENIVKSGYVNWPHDHCHNQTAYVNAGEVAENTTKHKTI